MLKLEKKEGLYFHMSLKISVRRLKSFLVYKLVSSLSNFQWGCTESFLKSSDLGYSEVLIKVNFNVTLSRLDAGLKLSCFMLIRCGSNQTHRFHIFHNLAI